MSDAHFFSPTYYQYVVKGGVRIEPPSRLSTETALGDRKANPFHALICLARKKEVQADALICCGDLTMCADPTAMNLGWLQLHRQAAELNAGEPIVTAGNHDLDSRFKTSSTSPQKMLRYLDPPFPTANLLASASYWSNGYCIIDRVPHLRVVLINTCSLHGYQNESDRQSDHGFIPDEVFSLLPDDLASRPHANMSILVCHHHPVEVDLPGEDKSIISNGEQLVELLTKLPSPAWMIVHGHRHLPKVHYASSAPNSPVIFSAGSLAASLHLSLQGRTANQFYLLEFEDDLSNMRGRYDAWTWDQNEGEWRTGQDTPAMPAAGGFGFRASPAETAAKIAGLVPPYSEGTITWRFAENSNPDLRYLLPTQRQAILDCLAGSHGIDWESGSKRSDVDARLLSLGRRP